MSALDSSRSSFPAEAWIATALLGQSPPAGSLTDAICGQIEKTATEHGVVALLHHTLSSTGAWAELPGQLRDFLLYQTRLKAAWDLRREADLGLLLEQLEKAAIPFLLIKGAGLAYTHYPLSYLRERCDADILFPDKAVFERAWVLLQSLGFMRRNTLSGEFVGYQHCCYRPLGSGFQQVLDCHIKINDYQFYADAFGFDELFSHSVALPQLAASARTLGAVHALLMACMHRVATLPHGIADRLIWLFDMYLLARSFSEEQWAEFLALAIARKLCGSCVHSLDAARVFFPIAAPAEVLARLQQFAEKEPFKPGQEMKRWRYYFHVFKTVPGVRKKARLLREHFLPSPEYLMEKYHTHNRFALPFLYVRRVFGGLRRYF